MSTAVIVFEPNPFGSPGAYATRAELPNGSALHVNGAQRVDRVELSRVGATDYLSFSITSAEARALATELLAAAAAVEALRGLPKGAA